MTDQKMLTVNEVAAKLNVSERTVRRWLADGELKAYNIGTKQRPEYRIQPEDLRLFLEKRQL